MTLYNLRLSQMRHLQMHNYAPPQKKRGGGRENFGTIYHYMILYLHFHLKHEDTSDSWNTTFINQTYAAQPVKIYVLRKAKWGKSNGHTCKTLSSRQPSSK